jgi:hypothetical protein
MLEARARAATVFCLRAAVGLAHIVALGFSPVLGRVEQMKDEIEKHCCTLRQG